MTDETDFFRAIQSNPADRTAKLVYADWLDERGEQEKAEYLRLSTALAEKRPGPDPRWQRLGELQARLETWLEVIRLPAWDPVPVYALGRLRGELAAFALLSGHEADISYDFEATLHPRIGPVVDMAAGWVGEQYAPVALEPLPDWEVALRETLGGWLFAELAHLRNGHSQLNFLTDRGRTEAVEQVVGLVRAVLSPVAGWRMRVTERRFYAIDWADIVLEGADRVLWLHFSFSD